jgi:hypothetical protein
MAVWLVIWKQHVNKARLPKTKIPSKCMAHGELVALWQPMAFTPFHASGMGFQLIHDLGENVEFP